jgi:hypothetical protein
MSLLVRKGNSGFFLDYLSFLNLFTLVYFIRFDGSLVLGHHWCQTPGYFCQHPRELSEFVWFEDLPEARQENSSDLDTLRELDEIHPILSKYTFDDLVWFENTKVITETEIKEARIERNDRTKHDIKNQTIKMGNLTRETLETLEMLDLNGYLHFVGFNTNYNQDDFDSKEQTNIREEEGLLNHIEEDKDTTL